MIPVRLCRSSPGALGVDGEGRAQRLMDGAELDVLAAFFAYRIS